MPYGPADAIDVSGLKRALVIQLRHHGDVLLTSPVFTVLKNHAPGIEVDALVYAETRHMLDLHPSIAQVHVIDRGWKALAATARLAREWQLHAWSLARAAAWCALRGGPELRQQARDLEEQFLASLSVAAPR
jgi:hypothetical protein